MLDAYIIDRIRRERERGHRKGALVPLHIEPPQPDPRPRHRREEAEDDQPKRGSIIIDFQV